MPTMIGAARATIPATNSTIFFAKLTSPATRPAKISWIRRHLLPRLAPPTFRVVFQY
jgi:hypothetical protein